MKFTFKRTMVDYCEIEAATLDEAETLVHSGLVEWTDDKWTCEIYIVDFENE